MNDQVEISPLTKIHAFRVNRDQIIDKIHTNVSSVIKMGKHS